MPLRLSPIAFGLLLVWAATGHGQPTDAALPGILEPSPETPPPPATLFPLPQPGWFVSLDGLLTHPRASTSGALLFPTFEGEVVPQLNWTVVPTGTLGYRFPAGNAVLASYRFLGDDGNGYYPVPGNPLAHDRWISNWLDLDYRGCLHGPWLSTTFQWQTGIRLAQVAYQAHSTQDVPQPLYDSQTLTDSKFTFLGGGPHFGIDLSHYFGQTGLGLFGRADLGVLIGQDRLSTVYTNTGPAVSFYSEPSRFVDAASMVGSLLEFRGEVGLSWSPATLRWMRFEAGYRDDRFAWRRDLVFPGPFLRCEVGF